MERDYENAVKILDYWYILEFLSQDKFPNYLEIQNKVKRYKDDLIKGKTQYNTIDTFILLQKEDVNKNIYEIILSEAKACGMKRWGNLTVYIGKVKREYCIEYISKFLPFDSEDDNRPERNQDRIAWVSLQLSSEGNYVEHTFSLSTILWTMKQIKTYGNNLSEVLDEKNYALAVEELEKKFFNKEKAMKQQAVENTEVDREKVKDEDVQTFDVSAITLKKLHEIYKDIEKIYIKGNIENTSDEEDAYEEIYGISFQLFKDEETKNKKEDENYLGLARDYFSDDIKMVLKLAEKNELANDKFLGKDLQKYITALTENNTKIAQRVDVVQPALGDLSEYKNMIVELMEMENAPMGKWPSRFMPALMQQMAINLAIGKGQSSLFNVNGKVFSVNGPPGTGKTTLLKEIVVNNVVERAYLLAEYDDPDDAFIKCDFIHGDKEEGAYSSYTRHWYRIKNDEINNYSMLVTSCNNAAVENISKELPKGVISDLNSLPGDSDELKSLLRCIAQMFDPEQSDFIETTHQGESYPDIYFTLYANALLEKDDAWGLIAAPLGKKANLSKFYNKILYPLSRDFYKDKSMAERRISRYKVAKDAFLKQLEVVKNQKKELGDLDKLLQSMSKKETEYIEAEKRVKVLDKQYEEVLIAVESERKKSEKVLTSRREEKRKKELSLNKLQRELEQQEYEIRKIYEQKNQDLDNEMSRRNSVGFLTKLFKNSKYQEVIRTAEVYKKKAEEKEQKIQEKEQHKETTIRKINEEKRLLDEYVQKIGSLEKEIEAYESDVRAARIRKINAENRMKKVKKELSSIKESVERKLLEIAEASDLDKQVIINEEYIKNLLSEEKNISTQAQVDNPWFTQRFNREREKLFLLAMRMNKEFVISSNKCRDNFNTISHYWGVKMGDESKRIIFHKEDKERMVASLFQTLFLLVPVISSTFASVGTLLKDVKKPGAIGVLVVDEAGQAQPQMAVGALYRSRKAIIVGDPKQVEPVVTDDLLLLKNVYSDELLKPYKNKTISVQSFADSLNKFGTYLGNGSDYPEWVGCPLLVHRRCISPMYDISNRLSYNGIMKQQTRAPKEKDAEKFIYRKSQWINVVGKENGNKNHYVKQQAEKVCELLEVAFTNKENPSIYIISPFTTVISGIKSYIKDYCKKNPSTKISENYILDYEQKKIGTVHTFQGKEADEVIFVLGCDASSESEGAIKWVNKNIVNVAATRAKYRLYVIGDEKAWSKSSCVSEAKQIMDTFAIKEIKSLTEKEMSIEDKTKALLDASYSLPAITQFTTIEVTGEDGKVDYSVDTSGLIQGLEEEFLTAKLSEEQLKRFGFMTMDDLNILSPKVKENLVLGMKLFLLLEPVYEINKKLDASCCAILFCKAMELHMKDCFTKGLKKTLPDFVIRGSGREKVLLKNARNKDLTLGTFDIILKKNIDILGQQMLMTGEVLCDEYWWRLFESRLNDCTARRNKCCHSGLFEWKDLSFLLYDMFKMHQTENIKGLMFESIVGTKL